jgi:hypothetical protein
MLHAACMVRYCCASKQAKAAFESSDGSTGFSRAGLCVLTLSGHATLLTMIV